jgi:hypothetical protein
MSHDSISFITLKGAKVRLDSLGGKVRISLQQGAALHQFYLLDIVPETDGVFSLIADKGARMQISEADALKARAFLDAARSAPQSNRGIWIAGGVIVAVIAVVIIGSAGGRNATSPAAPARLAGTSVSSQTGASTSASASSSSSAITETPDDWAYGASKDAMTGKVSHFAVVTSTNTVNFSFPYQGAQNGRLTLRQHPRYGDDVVLAIEQGQFLCPSYEDCTVLVKFDDKPAMSFSAVGAEDNSTETIFIRNYKRFTENLRGAKHVIIEAPVYQEGRPQFEFDVAGFTVAKLAASEP